MLVCFWSSFDCPAPLAITVALAGGVSLKSCFSMVFILPGIAGLVCSLWLLHHEYLVAHLFEYHFAEISDGRIAEEICQQESLLAWRDLAIHLGVLLCSISVTYLGALPFRGREFSSEMQDAKHGS